MQFGVNFLTETDCQVLMLYINLKQAVVGLKGSIVALKLGVGRRLRAMVRPFAMWDLPFNIGEHNRVWAIYLGNPRNCRAVCFTM
jgi:hypothetical protein